jgi:DNA-binding NtrC family response regulator
LTAGRTSGLILSYDRATREALRWAIGEVLDEVQTASSWQIALRQAGVQHPTVAVVDFDHVAPQGRVLLSNLLALRYGTYVIAIGSNDSVGDAARHGIHATMIKPVNQTRLMEHVSRAARGELGG